METEFSIISEDEKCEYVEATFPEFMQAVEHVKMNLEELQKQMNFWIEETEDDNLIKVTSKDEILSVIREDKPVAPISTEDEKLVQSEQIAEDNELKSEETFDEGEDELVLEEGYHVCRIAEDGDDEHYVVKETLSSAIEYMDINCLIDEEHYIAYVDLTGNEVEIYDKEQIEKTRLIDEELEKNVKNTLDILNQPLEQQRRIDKDKDLHFLLTELLVNKNDKPAPSSQTLSVQEISDVAEIHSMAKMVAKALDKLDKDDASVQVAIHCNKRCVELSQKLLKEKEKVSLEEEESFSSTPGSLAESVMKSVN